MSDKITLPLRKLEDEIAQLKRQRDELDRKIREMERQREERATQPSRKVRSLLLRK